MTAITDMCCFAAPAVRIRCRSAESQRYRLAGNCQPVALKREVSV
ncbi:MULTISPECIES: hypothetical protein [unclassified Erwinia]|nr:MULTISPECIES: hypothetical protein [unclassified Erwinia]